MTQAETIAGLRSLQDFLSTYGQAASAKDRAALDAAISALAPPSDAEVLACSQRLWEATQHRSVKRDPQAAVRAVLERSREFHHAAITSLEPSE